MNARAQRRPHVLIEKSTVVARKLMESPGEWQLVGVGDKSRERVLAQTAYRIREGKLAAFPITGAGKFEAVSTADQARADPIADVELYARYVPSDSGPPLS